MFSAVAMVRCFRLSWKDTPLLFKSPAPVKARVKALSWPRKSSLALSFLRFCDYCQCFPCKSSSGKPSLAIHQVEPCTKRTACWSPAACMALEEHCGAMLKVGRPRLTQKGVPVNLERELPQSVTWCGQLCSSTIQLSPSEECAAREMGSS